MPRTYTFGELIDAGALLVSDGYRAKNEELGGDGPIFLRAGHVTDTHIDFSSVDRFHSSLTPQVSQKMSKPGDVVVTTKGNSTGRVAFVTEVMPRFVYSPHLSFWRSLDSDWIVPEFLRHWSRSPEFRSQLSGLAASTDMAPYLSLADQRRLIITLPRVQEQQAVAEVLGNLDEKIDLNRRMNHTLESMARAIFKSWFMDFDPAGEVGSWNTGSGMIGGLATLSRDSLDPADYPEEIFDHYSIPSFDEGRSPAPEVGAAIKSIKLLVPAGSILLSKLNPRIPKSVDAKDLDRSALDLFD